MRSRYTAYTRMDEGHLRATWHGSTRPESLNLASDVPIKWIGLHVIRHEAESDGAAIVEFTARHRINGRACRMHETSRFVREGGRWFYVDGLVHPDRN